MIGFIIFCVFAFLGFLAISYVEVFYYVFKLIKEAIIMALDCLDTKRRKKSFKNRNNTESVENQKIIIDPMVQRKVDAMRMKYPYADESLYNRYLIKYKSLPLYEIEKIEYDIMYSHYVNENKPENKQVKHKISEVLSYRCFDYVILFPITMRFYKVGIEYILSIENDRTNEVVMYQSRSHNELLNICNEIYEKVSIKKQNNEEIIMNNLFNEENHKNLLKLD